MISVELVLSTSAGVAQFDAQQCVDRHVSVGDVVDGRLDLYELACTMCTGLFRSPPDTLHFSCVLYCVGPGDEVDKEPDECCGEILFSMGRYLDRLFVVHTERTEIPCDTHNWMIRVTKIGVAVVVSHPEKRGNALPYKCWDRESRVITPLQRDATEEECESVLVDARRSDAVVDALLFGKGDVAFRSTAEMCTMYPVVAFGRFESSDACRVTRPRGGQFRMSPRHVEFALRALRYSASEVKQIELEINHCLDRVDAMLALVRFTVPTDNDTYAAVSVGRRIVCFLRRLILNFCIFCDIFAVHVHAGRSMDRIRNTWSCFGYDDGPLQTKMQGLVSEFDAVYHGPVDTVGEEV